MVNTCGRCGYHGRGYCSYILGLRVENVDPGCKFFCSNPPICTRCGAVLKNEETLIVDEKIYCVNCGSQV